MSRTPEIVKNKKAISTRNWMYGIGVFFGLAAFGAFNNGDAEGGFWMAVVAVALFWIGGKIKTTYRKQGEVGVYK